jgi:pheromone shutdown-related protein TraB
MAIAQARARHLPVLLVDREIGVTLKRVAANLSWWKRLELFSGLVLTLVSHEEVPEAEIERLKEGDVLETTFAEFARNRQDLFLPLIDERDRYMAARLREEIEREGHGRVLAVLGAGHLKGVAGYLRAAESEPPPGASTHEGTQPRPDPRLEIEELERLPPPSPWPKLISWVILALIVAGFAFGFAQNPQDGWSIVWDWVLITGSLSALGTLLAGGHPLTVLTAFVAAPLTTLNPAIGAGMVTAPVELYLRKPNHGRLRPPAPGRGPLPGLVAQPGAAHPPGLPPEQPGRRHRHLCRRFPHLRPLSSPEPRFPQPPGCGGADTQRPRMALR